MSIGKLTEFNIRSGNWTMYVERMEMFFKVNNVKEEFWLPTLIAAMGDEAYELISNLTSPGKPSAKTYAEVVKVMTDHLQPKPSFMAERYRFRQRRQNAGESILQYISELKKMSKFCEFTSVLEENLRDQLVCGLRSESIRQRLFTEENLQYANAVKISCAMESAERDAAAVEQTVGKNSDSGGSGDNAAGALHAVVASSSGGRRGRDGSRGLLAARNVTAEDSKNNCSACGASDHQRERCRYSRFICGRCRQKGHLRRVCPVRSGGRQPKDRCDTNNLVAHVQAAGGVANQSNLWNHTGEDKPPLSDEEDWEVEDLHQLSLNSYKPVSLTIYVDQTQLSMEIDTGSLVSCISREKYDQLFSHRPLDNSNLVFRFYDGTITKPLGVIRPMVKYGNKSKQMELFVIEGGTTSLLGRQWLTELGIKIPSYQNMITLSADQRNSNVSGNDQLTLLLHRYKDLFSEGLGRFTGGKARLRLREGATPVFCRARPVPYALRERVEAELEGMLRAGVIEPVECADWATPLVPVRKADGGLRICADYKITLNPVLLVDKYPLPLINDLLVKLNGSKIFTKIDLTQAYNQIELDDPDNCTVINTHKGLFKYKRLVFGLSSSPGILQRIMANLLNDIPNVEVFLDDIIIGSPNIREHLVILERVLERLHHNGMKLNKKKCMFLTNEVKYLGFIISAEGIKVDPEKVEGTLNIPRPENITDLRAFLGTIMYYAKFVKNLSNILAPLYRLLKKGVAWTWNDECESSFKRIKNILISADVLAHYEPNKPLFLTCDASARGIGGVLSQMGELNDSSTGGQQERPVVYVSRALNAAEKHYSQIEREALAIVFCLEKLHQYLYGRRFTLRTDHKPLVTIFGPKQGIPSMAASRLQRWAIKLSAYTYDIEYVSSKQNGADGLSRLPALSTIKQPIKVPEQSYLHFAQNAMLLDYNEIKRQTSRDQLLGRVLTYLRDEWPSDNEIKSLQPYFNRKKELYEELGCVMWGHRVVVPGECRNKVLMDLHEPHMGIVKTKAFARSYVWWPGMDEEIEKTCRGCSVCAAESEAPPRHMPCPWVWPDRPWARVHVDFLGPITGRIFLVMVDARTKWLEVSQVPSTAASHTISVLSDVFARFGLPRQIVSDNGPPFTSHEFSQFLATNGIEQIFSAPYHPASNGAAENAVHTVKRAIKKAIRENLNINLFLNNFLLYYRNTEHCTTGETPASLMFGRRLRTKFDALRPSRDSRVRDAQERQQKYGASGLRQLRPGDEVWLRQYRGQDKWVSGKIAEKMGTTDYKVVDALGRESHKHVDQLKPRIRSSLICPSPSSPISDNSETVEVTQEQGAPSPGGPRSEGSTAATTHQDDGEGESFEDCVEQPVQSSTQPSLPSPEPPQSRPVRQCRIDKPARYNLW